MADDPITLPEKYAHATGSGNLLLRDDRQTDIDVIIAAGFAQRGDRKGMLAMHLQRAKHHHNMAGIGVVIVEAMQWLMDREVNARRNPLYRRPDRAGARRIVETVLRWWLTDVCKACRGARWKLIPGTQIRGEMCDVCQGTAIRPLETMLRSDDIEQGRWLVSQIEEHLSYVIQAMMKALRNRI